MKKEEIIILAVAVFLAFLIYVQADSSSSGTVSVLVEMPPYKIYIDSPKNTTYNFAKGVPYTLDMNVSANFTVNTWQFYLYDNTHNQVVNETTIFTPNMTFNAARWSNTLTIFANDSDGREINNSVTFYVSIPNSAPEILSLDSQIYVCEGKDLLHEFTINDTDEEAITLSIFPTGNFSVYPATSQHPHTDPLPHIFNSVPITKSLVGDHAKTIQILDPWDLPDTATTTITVIEINNNVSMDTLTFQTVGILDPNPYFSKQVIVTDTEDGNQYDGNLSFNLSMTPTKLFDINTTGAMNFTPNSTHIGEYEIKVCVTDNALANPHAQIVAQCGQTGTNNTVCQTFNLTIVNSNQAPSITDYYPTILSFSNPGTTTLNFNVTNSDPDGSTPNTYWSLDNITQEIDTGSAIDSFSYNFGCGVSGEYVIKARVTDGLLNKTIQWNITITEETCPTVTLGGSGGGGGGGSACTEKWACLDWDPCRNTERSAAIGLLSLEELQEIRTKCSEKNWDEEICGFHIRSCTDVNGCNIVTNKPETMEECYFTINPSCTDGIKNCHDDSCEFLTDCGGPCDPCPTCSDGIQNQGEENIDCGGPCPWQCPPEKPLLKQPGIRYTLIIIAAILVIILLIKIKNILQIKKQMKK